MTDTPAMTKPKSDGEQLLDAQLLLGMIERYRPGTVQEARDWFGDLLKDALVKADADGPNCPATDTQTSGALPQNQDFEGSV